MVDTNSPNDRGEAGNSSSALPAPDPPLFVHWCESTYVFAMHIIIFMIRIKHERNIRVRRESIKTGASISVSNITLSEIVSILITVSCDGNGFNCILLLP